MSFRTLSLSQTNFRYPVLILDLYYVLLTNVKQYESKCSNLYFMFWTPNKYIVLLTMYLFLHNCTQIYMHFCTFSSDQHIKNTYFYTMQWRLQYEKKTAKSFVNLGLFYQLRYIVFLIFKMFDLGNKKLWEKK